MVWKVWASDFKISLGMLFGHGTFLRERFLKHALYMFWLQRSLIRTFGGHLLWRMRPCGPWHMYYHAAHTHMAR